MGPAPAGAPAGADSRVAHFLRHRDRITIEDLTEALAGRYSLSESDIWQSVEALRRAGQVSVLYPHADRRGAIISALWQG